MILTLLGCLQAVGPKIAAGETDTATQDCSQLWYVDHDGDGVGSGDGIAACEAPTGFAGENGDCNDDSVNIHPNAVEHCDGLDEDCDGTADNAAVDQTQRWPDLDGDGFGNPTTDPILACPTPETTPTPGDCDDDDGNRSPDAAEICQDGIDNDCNGAIDACTTLPWESGRTSTGDAGSRLGATVALGDFDGDNVVDAIAGAPDDVRGGQNAGAVVLLRNQAAGERPTTLMLGVPDQFLGAALTVADVDADGRDDVLASGDWTGDATLAFAGGGALSLVGMAGRLLLADLDGDGADEAVLGSLDAAGSVCVVAGPLTRGEVVDVARGGARCTSGESTGDAAGYALAAGDFDGDGSADLAVGAPAAANAAGRVYVPSHSAADTSLAATPTQLSGAAPWARAGVALQAGDLDGNGADDLVVGAEGDGPDGSGVAWLQYGPLATGTGTLAGDAIRGETRLDYAGVSLDLADVDDDGWLDLLLGAPLYGAPDEGAAYLVFGPVRDGDLKSAGETYATARVSAGATGSWTGWSVSAAHGTIAVGAPASSENSGATAVFSIDRRKDDR